MHLFDQDLEEHQGISERERYNVYRCMINTVKDKTGKDKVEVNVEALDIPRWHDVQQD